jgi:hypothetical protein
MPFLEALSAKDFGVFVNNQDFVGVQDATDETRQEIQWRGMFGVDGPAIRSIRHADEDTFSFTAIILKAGAVKGLNKKSQLKKMRDFEVKIKDGSEITTYRNCNWSRVAVRRTQTEATLDCDISIPGYTGEGEIVS